MKTFKTLMITELKISLRDMNMLIFAIFMPIIILVILGMISGEKLAYEGAGFTFFEQSFGAVATIAICAGGVMGLPLVISDYRGKLILKRFKVTPIQPRMLLAVQLAIYGLYSVISLLTLFPIAIIFFDFHMEGNLLQFMLGWLLVLISMFSIGLMVGGIAKNQKIAGVIATFLYFPMLIFSGSTLPYEVMPKGLQAAVNFMPLTQGNKILKSAVLGAPLDNLFLPLIFLFLITIICCGISLRFFRWE